MFIKIIKKIFGIRFIINPFIRYQSDYLGEMQGVNQLKRELPIIVSLTSTEDRFDDLELVLYSLVTQKTKPDRIILWLSDEYELPELPYSVTKYMKNGLEIRFVKDLGNYSKIIYPLKEFGNSIIVTAEDSVYYSANWLKRLYESYVATPSDVHVHKAKKIELNPVSNRKEEMFVPSGDWKDTEDEMASYDNFINGAGGVLYPPRCFSNEIYREDIFLKEVDDDDIWCWFMSLISNRKIRVVKYHIKNFASVNIFAYFCNKKKREIRRKKRDKQIACLMKYYGQNILSKLS